VVGAGLGGGVGTIGAAGGRPVPSQADKRTAEIKTADKRFITVSLVLAKPANVVPIYGAGTRREYWLERVDLTRRQPPICENRESAMNTLGPAGNAAD